MIAQNDFTLKCPKCGSPLEFDMHLRKYTRENKDCKSMWSFELKGNKMIWHEWKVAEKGSIMYDFIMATAVWDDDKHKKQEDKL